MRPVPSTPLTTPLDPASDASREAHPDEDAVVLLDEGKLTFTNPKRARDGYTLESTFRVRVLTPAGRAYGRVSIFLDPWEELVEVSGRSYDPVAADATVAVLPPNAVAFRTAAPAAGTLYSQARFAEFDVPGVDVGDVIEYRTVVRSRQSFSLPRWSFDGREPVRTSRLVVDVPKGWRLSWGFWNGAQREAFEPEVTDLGPSQRLTFARNQLRARRAEPQAPPFTGWRQRLQIAIAEAPGEDGRDRFARWEDIGAWYRGLTSGRDTITEREWQSVLQTVGANPRAQDLFAYVRDHVRYVQLYEDWLGGYQPHDASQVLDKRFGDCKDMATLLVTLLRRIGVEAHPMLVGVANRVFFDESFPTVRAFNHLVVALPQPGGGYRYLDPTDKESPFGALPWHLEGQGALVVKRSGVHLHRVPRLGPEHHATNLELEVVDATHLKVKAHLRGDAAWGWTWASREHPAVLEGRIARSFLARLSVAKVSDAALEIREDGVHVTANAEVASIERAASGLRIIPLAPFLPSRLLEDPVESRESAVHLNRPGSWQVKLRIPTGSAQVSLPEVTQAEMKQLSHRFRSDTKGGVVEVETTLVVRDPLVPKSELAALRAVDRQIGKARESAVVLKKVTR